MSPCRGLFLVQDHCYYPLSSQCHVISWDVVANGPYIEWPGRHKHIISKTHKVAAPVYVLLERTDNDKEKVALDIMVCQTLQPFTRKYCCSRYRISWQCIWVVPLSLHCCAKLVALCRRPVLLAKVNENREIVSGTPPHCLNFNFHFQWKLFTFNENFILSMKTFHFQLKLFYFLWKLFTFTKNFESNKCYWLKW